MAHIVRDSERELGNEENKNFHRNLSNQEVRDIRAEYLHGATQKKLADTYGLSIKSIYKIVHLIDYKHIKEEENYLGKLQERLGK